MIFDRSQARRIAELAQLDLDGEELEGLVDSMAGIVSLIAELDGYESLAEPPDPTASEVPPARAEWDDEPEPGTDPERVRANAPATSSDGAITVPPMMLRVPRS